jgi:hypothetical protein
MATGNEKMQVSPGYGNDFIAIINLENVWVEAKTVLLTRIQPEILNFFNFSIMTTGN